MTKNITVYWACTEDEWVQAVEPEKVASRFHTKGIISNDLLSPMAINYCPAFNKSMQNVYAIKSIYDYSFTIKDGQVVSNYYDQKFFDNHVIIRSVEKKLFSFLNRYIFFTEEDSLDITATEHAVYEQNNISRRCMPVTGTYNIGKWFRPIDFAFILRDEYNSFDVQANDVLYYLRIHTDAKIIFKQFVYTENIKNLYNSTNVANSRRPMSKINIPKSLEEFYNLFRHKKYLLGEIKKNLL